MTENEAVTKQKLVIVGAGGFGRELYQLITDINQNGGDLEVLGFVDNSIPIKLPKQVSVLGTDQWAFKHLNKNHFFTLGLGNSRIRQKLSKTYLAAGLNPINLIHPDVHIGYNFILGEGNIICAGTIITTDVKIGNFVNINLQCTLGHDCRLGNFVSLHPGVRISGNVEIGAGTEVGTGAILLPGVKVGENCTIGAGAVVTKNCEAGKTYVGIPAREMTKNG
ncbi:MAG: acetyltransferase [Bacteroidia bacterium]|nr:acetyltransferase [Bacteroidia bacterium]